MMLSTSLWQQELTNNNAPCCLSRSYSFIGGEEKNLYTPFVAYSFTVNYILGVGSLGIPYAFYRAGIGVGIALIIVVSFLSMITGM